MTLSNPYLAKMAELMEEKDQQIARLKDAAKGRGMVSEMADMEEVAVLVVGLHTEIAALQAKLEATGSAVDHVDLMIDEFKRIKSCPEVTQEIVGLCDRAIARTSQNVPVIVQRDDAQKQIASLTAERDALRGKDRGDYPVSHAAYTTCLAERDALQDKLEARHTSEMLGRESDMESAHADVRKFKENCCDSCRKILDQG